ncbi:hypothetical protein POX_e06911 [Penicillium oxalicum]|uniref:hypothetical protein n=1 Tax=Penicillium oxalicum TaxID=69781 RepID=UPI0020B8134A|nr:hypothetical protein POX_e06911 [Penicillium oxalicum]KAI2788887.1 hypothetical protein POX_e06911 [Penicillium oxalicum]
MGGAILYRVVDAMVQEEKTRMANLVSEPDEASPLRESNYKFIACTKTSVSAERLLGSLTPEQRSYVSVTHSLNVPVEVIENADIVVLAFKPFMAEDVLTTPGMHQALAGKLVISVLAGQTPQDLTRMILRSEAIGPSQLDSRANPVLMSRPIVVKAIPNMAARYSQSTTIIETPEERLPDHMSSFVEWLFSQVGTIKYLPPNQMDLGSVLVGATLAAMTVPVEGMLDGCVVEGMKRPDAMELMIGGLKGLTAALEAGVHPAVLRESISSPRGCTIQALLTLEKAGSRADYAEAIINGTQHLKKPKH